MRNNVIVVGSAAPESNTLALAQACAQGANEAGHQTQLFLLGNEPLHGCRGCGACQLTHHCVQRDAMDQILPAIQACDTLILASPLYFWTISASMKAFIERLYVLSEKDQYPIKDCALLMSAGDEQFWTFEQPLAYYHFLTQALGWQDLGSCLIGGCPGHGRHWEAKPAALQKAESFGRLLGNRPKLLKAHA